MLAVQVAGGRIRTIVVLGRAIACALIAGAAIVSVMVALAVPCEHRQRIGTSGFSLGDQCLQR